MKDGFRQSMAFLHTWSGLLLGWLLFAVFFTGTTAYFRQEITEWMQPEVHMSQPGPKSAELALARLSDVAPGAEDWRVSLPNSRSNTISNSWNMPGEPPRKGGGHREQLDAGTGEVLNPRDTAGGGFLYRFHFELHGLPRQWQRWPVGIATMFMFIAIISGIITHKRIFRDFFTFRPGKGQRSWLDAHNVTSVLSLPFHIMITYSGLLLFMTTLMPFALENGGRRGERPSGPRPAETEQVVGDISLASISPIIASVEAETGKRIGQISVVKPGSDTPVYELRTVSDGRFDITVGGGGRGGGDAIRFDARTGERLTETGREPQRGVSPVRAVNNLFGSLHRARFAETGLRWLFFLCGVGGTIMVGTGLSLWVSKRAIKNMKAGKTPWGHTFVEKMNIASINGLAIATAAYFWGSRIIPAGLANRPEWEINTFFIAWAIAGIYALVRPTPRAWVETSLICGAMFAGLPFLNAATSQANLIVATFQGNWIIAGFDFVALLTGGAYGWMAWKLHRKQTQPAPVKRRPRRAAVPETEVPAE